MIASRFPLMSCLILEPLAGRTGNGVCGPLCIVDAEGRTVVHAEIELCQVPIRVLV
jgi:hypothetical protein